MSATFNLSFIKKRKTTVNILPMFIPFLLHVIIDSFYLP